MIEPTHERGTLVASGPYEHTFETEIEYDENGEPHVPLRPTHTITTATERDKRLSQMVGKMHLDVTTFTLPPAPPRWWPTSTTYGPPHAPVHFISWWWPEELAPGWARFPPLSTEASAEIWALAREAQAT